jgi:hypothetical protein
MAILEICQLKIKPDLSEDDPSLLLALQKARTGLREKVVDTQSRFYRCIEDPSLIYILGLWPSLERHEEFLVSPHKAEILDEQDELFDFKWILHTGIEGGLDMVPVQAPVIGIARLLIKKERVSTFQGVVDQYGDLIEEGTKPYKPFAAWRVDCEDGNYEHLTITGWEKEGDHAAFTQKTRQEYLEYAGVRENYEGMDVKHVRDMER